MSIHLELADAVRKRFAEHLAGPPELRQDALLLELANGVRLEVRYVAADAYSLRWQHGDVWRGIDTAPCHPGLGSYPNHFHAGDGSVRDDPVTRCGAEPRDNLLRLLAALLDESPALAA